MNYKIAGVNISLPNSLIEGHFAKALEPFINLNSSANNQLVVRLGEVASEQIDYKQISVFDFRDADSECRFGRDAMGYLFIMEPRDGAKMVKMRIGVGQGDAVTDFVAGNDPSLMRFGLWVLYNIVSAAQKAIAIHTSVIEYDGQGVLFLGESGTGKSTHTRLWRENIEGATLLNDDSPIVYIDSQGRAMVSGSPWSGKTPCYKNRQLPIRAIVRLSQGPKNRIRQLNPIEAIGALLPSAPPAFAHDDALQDCVCATLSGVLSKVKVYHLDCLPDQAAAQLSFKTIFAEK